MAYNNYVPLTTTGTPRINRRKVFYLVLGTLLGVLVIIGLFRGRAHDRHLVDITRYRVDHRNSHDHAFDHVANLSHQHHQKYDNDYPETHQHDSMRNDHHDHDQEKNRTAYLHDEHVDREKLINFHPTNDWQIVPDNAVLPAGLEIKIDFTTGKKMARNHPSSHNIHHDLPVSLRDHTTTPKERNLIEQRLEEAVSENHDVQRQALDHLDVEAHRLDVGESITHARNFKNLIGLLESKLSEALRLEAASIIAACLHTNKGAVEGALMSNLISKAIARLEVETDAQVQRRIIAILTYMAEGDLLATLHQFVTMKGFEVLNKILARGLDPAAITRTVVLLATLARGEAHEHSVAALTLLDNYLSRITKRVDDAYIDSFRPICEAQTKTSQLRYRNINDFCKRFVK